MRKYFEHAGALMTADGTDDHRIKLEGVPKGHKFTFSAAGWEGRGAWAQIALYGHGAMISDVAHCARRRVLPPPPRRVLPPTGGAAPLRGPRLLLLPEASAYSLRLAPHLRFYLLYMRSNVHLETRIGLGSRCASKRTFCCMMCTCALFAMLYLSTRRCAHAI